MTAPDAQSTERRVVEVPITLHRNDIGLHAWADEDEVGEEIAGDLDIEEIERRLFDRFPEVLLQNAEENLTPEWCRNTEEAPRVAIAEYFPEAGALGGVALSMDQRAQWAMIPRSEGGEGA